MTDRVDIQGASTYTGMKVNTLRSRRANDQPPPSYTCAGRLYYDVVDLEVFMAQQKADSLRGER
jgi:hypothetical protein